MAYWLPSGPAEVYCARVQPPAPMPGSWSFTSIWPVSSIRHTVIVRPLFPVSPSEVIAILDVVISPSLISWAVMVSPPGSESLCSLARSWNALPYCWPGLFIRIGRSAIFDFVPSTLGFSHFPEPAAILPLSSYDGAAISKEMPSHGCAFSLYIGTPSARICPVASMVALSFSKKNSKGKTGHCLLPPVNPLAQQDVSVKS